MTQFHSEASHEEIRQIPRATTRKLAGGQSQAEGGVMGLTWAQVQQVHRWDKNTNYTIAEMARKLDCPSVWVVWALEGR